MPGGPAAQEGRRVDVGTAECGDVNEDVDADENECADADECVDADEDEDEDEGRDMRPPPAV